MSVHPIIGMTLDSYVMSTTWLLLKVFRRKAADSSLCKAEYLPFRCLNFCSNSVDDIGCTEDKRNV